MMTEHRWSGWPGAWCLDCGAEDPREVALAEGRCSSAPCRKDDGIADAMGRCLRCGAEHAVDCETLRMECPEPGSRRHDPYASRR